MAVLDQRMSPGWVCLLGTVFLVCSGCAITHEQAQLHLADGDAALAAKDLETALVEFREAVRLDPSFAEAHTKLGLAYKQKGDLPGAAESLKRAVRLDPSDFVSTFELGEVYRLLNKLTQAIRAYLIACELDPLNYDARVGLAGCYHRNGELTQAAAAYEEALGIDADNAVAWSNLGAIYHTQNRPYDALRAYKESLECDTRQPAVLVNMATVYLRQRRWSTAQHTLRIALDQAPDFSPAHERLGYCLWQQTLYEQAAAEYREAIQLDRKNAAAYAGYGVVRMTQYLNDPARVAFRDEAVEAWHTSLEIKPEQPKLRTLINKYRPEEEPPVLSYED